MPTLTTLLAFLAAAAVLVVVPGPNLIYLVTRSVSEGRRAGIRSALGFETGTMVHIAAATLGLSALLASSATAFGVVKYAGAAYLVYLGITTLRARTGARASATRLNTGGAFRQAIVVQVLNPKVAIFFLAFLPQFIDPHRAAALQVLILGLVLSVLELSVNLVAASIAGWVALRLRGRPSGRPWGRWSSGTIYLALGAAAAIGPGHRSSTG